MPCVFTIPACSSAQRSTQASAQGLVRHRHVSAPLAALNRPLMVGFSEGSLLANLKNWARRSTRQERTVAKQSRRTLQHLISTDEAEQSQRTSSVAHLAVNVEVEQSQHTSAVSQPRAAIAEAKQNQRESLVTQKGPTAVETEQSQRTSFVAQHPEIAL